MNTQEERARYTLADIITKAYYAIRVVKRLIEHPGFGPNVALDLMLQALSDVMADMLAEVGTLDEHTQVVDPNQVGLFVSGLVEHALSDVLAEDERVLGTRTINMFKKTATEVVTNARLVKWAGVIKHADFALIWCESNQRYVILTTTHNARLDGQRRGLFSLIFNTYTNRKSALLGISKFKQQMPSGARLAICMEHDSKGYRIPESDVKLEFFTAP